MHQDKKADKMLSELEQEKNNMNKKEKQILLQFQKNKKRSVKNCFMQRGLQN